MAAYISSSAVESVVWDDTGCSIERSSGNRVCHMRFGLSTGYAHDRQAKCGTVAILRDRDGRAIGNTSDRRRAILGNGAVIYDLLSCARHRPHSEYGRSR